MEPALAGTESTRLNGVLNLLDVGMRCAEKPAAAEVTFRGLVSDSSTSDLRRRNPPLRPIDGKGGGAMSPAEDVFFRRPMSPVDAVPVRRAFLGTDGPASAFKGGEGGGRATGRVTG